MLRESTPTVANAAEVLLGHMPVKLTRRGVGLLRKMLRDILPAMPLTLTENGSVSGLSNDGWNEIWQAFRRLSSKRETTRRYKSMLMKVAQHWHQQGLIAELPDFYLPPQHRRRLTVAPDRLQGCLFSNYQQLTAWIIKRLSGASGSLDFGFTTAGSNANAGSGSEAGSECFDHWLTLLMICAGVCDSQPLGVLSKLRAEDILLTLPVEPAAGPWLVIRLPRRTGRSYTWLRLPKITGLFLYAALFRAKQGSGPLAFWSRPTYQKRFSRFLKAICNQAGVPPISYQQLIQCVRLDLCQVLPNLNLAVLTGQLVIGPVPADQMIEILYDQRITVPPEYHWKPAEQSLDAMPETEAEDSIECMEPDVDVLTEYDNLIEKFSTYVYGLNTISQEKLAALEKWSRQVTRGEPDGPIQLARFNLGWLIRWQLWLLRERSRDVESSTRRSYWSSVLRVLRFLPSAPVHKVTANMLRSVVEALPLDTSAAPLRAWKQFWKFMKQRKPDTAEIQWNQVKVPSIVGPVRVLTDSVLPELLSSLPVPIRRAAKLGLWAGLRVSEVCRLQTEDVVLEHWPHLLVADSKGGKSRFVPLGDLSADELSVLKQYYESQKGKSASGPFLHDQGSPLDPQRVSGVMSAELERLGYRQEDLEGLILTFHALRKFKANLLMEIFQDVRYVAAVLGHALAATTTGSYLHRLDLITVKRLEQWPSELNRSNIHLPVVLLAELLDVDRSRVRQMIQEHNQANPQKPICPVKPIPRLPDGQERTGPNQRADYLSMEDAVRLFHWILQKRFGKGRCTTSDCEAPPP